MVESVEDGRRKRGRQEKGRDVEKSQGGQWSRVSMTEERSRRAWTETLLPSRAVSKAVQDFRRVVPVLWTD